MACQNKKAQNKYCFELFAFGLRLTYSDTLIFLYINA